MASSYIIVQYIIPPADPVESSQELPSVPQSDTETVATDDDIESDLHSEEENSLPRITWFDIGMKEVRFWFSSNLFQL